MLHVKTPDEALEIIRSAFVPLDRPPEDIAGEDHGGRPLIGSDRERVFQLYTQRIHLYRKYGAYTISNPKTPEEAAERIAALYRKECQP